MKFQEIVQNTDEWLALRMTKIGASEANIIMGVSEYSTPRELWTHKINPNPQKQETSFIQAKGHKTEIRLRAYIEMKLGHEFPAMVALSEEHDFLMASLDGYCQELNALFEGKLVGKDDFQLVVSGKCLPQYFPQIQQQLLVTGAEKCFLVVGVDDKESEKKGALKFTVLEVFPDLEYIQNKLYPALVAFWKCVQTKTPPPLSKDDVLDLNNPELVDMLTRYKLMVEEQEEVEERVKKLKEEIFKFTMKKHSKVSCNGITIYAIQNKDSVTCDVDKWIEDYKLEIPAKYYGTKKGALTKKITFPKAKKEKEE